MGGFRSSGLGSKGSVSKTEREIPVSTPLRQVISTLEELDRSRQQVAKKEQELEKARQDMATNAQRVQTVLENLDPSTRDMVKGLLGQIDSKEETKGKSR